MHSWIVGLTCLSLVGNFIPKIETTPVGSSLGSLVHGPPKHERRAEFGEGIRDWFRNMKNRIFGGSNDRDVLPPVEAEKMMLELENEDLEERKRKNPEGFFLDLSNLTFDPKTDWGFHLGKWYFIRKSYDTSIIDCNTYQPAYPDWRMSKEDRDDDIAPPSITAIPDKDVASTELSTTTEETSDVPGTIIPVGKDEDNETQSPGEDDRSTEVLGPSK